MRSIIQKCNDGSGKIQICLVLSRDRLINMCMDKGCAQITHTDLDRVLFMNQTPHTDVVH